MPIHVPEKFRATFGYGEYDSTAADGNNGLFFVTIKNILFKILASEASEEYPWDHVSISLRTRCPNWAEMCAIKDMFFDDDVVVQFHPAKKDYVNFHPFCLHLWRFAGVLPIPDKILV